MSTSLAQEMATYQQLLPELLLCHEGKFAVIAGDELLNTCTSYEDALQIGYEKCGLDKRFLVKKIQAAEPVNFFTRDLCLI